jgi:phosphatidylglycerol---prolipoprotein diacylglyceryl transferase
VKPMIPWFDAPVLEIPLGDFVLPIHGFGVMVALGFVFGGQVAMNRAKKLGLDPEVINRLIGWLVVGTFIGGHVGYGLMYEPDVYLANPIEFLKVWKGLSSFGGFAVCVPLSVWFFYKEKVPVWPFLDCLAFGMAMGWFFGRMGCFVAHDHPGTVTNFYLGVFGICKGFGKDVACHDMGLYEALWSLGMYLLFRALDFKARTPGFYVLLLGLAYGPVRFGMDFLRPEVTDARYMGFTPGHYWSGLVTVLCLALFAYVMQRGQTPYPFAESNSGEPADVEKPTG